MDRTSVPYASLSEFCEPEEIVIAIHGQLDATLAVGSWHRLQFGFVRGSLVWSAILVAEVNA